MIAVYKGNKYKFVLNKRRKGIITRCVQKTDGSFFKENDIYYKPVDEKDLSDIYAVEFYVFFDTGFKDVSTWWKITEADLLDNKVKLRFAEGIPPLQRTDTSMSRPIFLSTTRNGIGFAVPNLLSTSSFVLK